RLAPNLLVSSAATQPASSVGSIVVSPPSSAMRRGMAATVAAGGGPGLAPGAPRQEAGSVVASRAGRRAPPGRREDKGEPPGHIRIQVIGTPPSRLAAPSANAFRDAGWRCA